MLLGLGPKGGGLFAGALRQSSSYWPGVLFTGGKQGIWLDPSDRSTLFQDAAGTIPAAAPGDPVGLALDKSGNGNHASQATAAARPLLARTVPGGRRNRLRQTAALNGSEWLGAAAASASGNSPVGPAYKVEATEISGLPQIYQTLTGLTAVGPMVDSWVVKAGSLSRVSVSVFDGGGTRYEAEFNLASGLWGAVAPELNALPPVNLGDGWWRLSVYRNRDAAPNYVALTLLGPTSPFDLSPEDWLLAAAPQLEYGATASAVQIVADAGALDITEADKVELWGLYFDGVDDYLATPAIDLTASPGLTFTSALGMAAAPSAAGFVVGQGSTGFNSFFTFALTSETLASYYTGSSQVSATHAAYTYPMRDVVTGRADFSAPSIEHWAGGVLRQTTTSDPGSGNFRDEAVYVGAGEPGLYLFRGDLFGLVVVNRVDFDLAALHGHLAGKAGVSL